MADPFLTRTETAAWLGLDPTNPLLSSIIQTATDAVIDVMNGDPRAQDYDEWRNGTGGQAQLVKFGPIISVNQVNVAGTAVDLAGVTWDDNLIYRTLGWPRGLRNVHILYTAGYEDLPSPVRQATLYTAKAIYGAQRVDMNATGENFAGVLSNSFWQTGPGAVPPAARSMLQNYTNRYFP